METRTDLTVTLPRQRLEFAYDNQGRRMHKQVFHRDDANSNISIFQYFNISVFQYFSISVFQISAFQHFIYRPLRPNPHRHRLRRQPPKPPLLLPHRLTARHPFGTNLRFG